MIFFKRPDLDASIRTFLALKMINRTIDGERGLVTDLAREYGVSRQFLYDNLARLQTFFAAETAPPATPTSAFTHQLILCLRLFCNSPIEGISRTLETMGLAPSSAGHISEFLRATANACSLAIPYAKSATAILVDEIFVNNTPIFVVLEALSHAILDIRIMPDRQGKTWAAVLRQLQDRGLHIGLLVKDQGSGLKAAAQELELPERADLFHLLHPFDRFLASLERRGYGAIEEESKRARVFTNRKCETILQKALDNYDEAELEARKAMRAYDNYNYLHQCLHEAFDSFTTDGRVRTKAMAEGDINAALSLLAIEFASHQGILAAANFLRNNISDHWSYFTQLEGIMQSQAQKITEHTLRAGCLAWQLQRKAMAAKSTPCKKALARQAEAQMTLALTGADKSLPDAFKALFTELDANVRSSSPLEAINSIIRTYLNACRGQTTQESLILLAYFMNHRRATRGKYTGSSPHERLTGKPETEAVIDQLWQLFQKAEKVKAQGAPQPRLSGRRKAA